MDKEWPAAGGHRCNGARATARAVLLLLALLLPALPPTTVAADAGAAWDVPLHRWSWQTWSSESGLPQISAKALAVDHDGLLWVGTENGLARFDGTRFEVFTPGNTPQLGASWITQLMVDRQGRVWIGNLRNLVVFEDGRFLGSDELGEVTALGQDEAGRILAGGDRLYQAVPDGGRVLVTPAEDDDGPVTALLAVGGDGVWVGERSGRLRHLRGGNERVWRLPPEVTRVSALAWLDGRLWLGTDAGLYRHDGKALARVVLQPGGDGEVQALSADTHGTLWIANHSLVFRRFPDGRMETVAGPVAHAFPWVMAFLPTADGMWMGSQYHGLRHYWLPAVQRLGEEEGLHDRSLWSVVPDGDGLLVGTDDGVARWDGELFRLLVPGSRLPHPAAYSLLRDSRGGLWVGTRSGLQRFDARLREGHTFPELRGIRVNGLFERPDGSLWIATSAGLFHCPADTAAGRPEPVDSLLTGLGVRALDWTDDGTLWIGTENGLFRRQDGRVQPAVGTGMDGAFITAVRALPGGRLVVGSYDRGISLGDGRGGWWHHTRATGLPSDTVFNLQPVADGVLVSFADGVYHWRLPGEEAPAVTPAWRMLLYDFGDHPGRSRTRCCNGGGNDKGAVHQGAYWLPSLNGLVRVPLDLPAEPGPVVDVVSVNGTVPAGPLVELGERRDLAIRFRSVDFRQGFRLQFRHRLHGVDPDWVETGQQDTVSYMQLHAGRYRFDIQARLPYQSWGETTSLHIQVPARFVETPAFRLLMLLLALLLVWLLMRWRERLLRQQKQRLEEIVARRTSELAEANLRLAELNRVLNQASRSDPLTGLGNRRHLLQAAGRVQARVRDAWLAGAGTPVMGVVVLDIDHFKQINDALGHLAGDAVLCRVARLLVRAVGSDDDVARWGGEEFVVVTKAASPEELLAYAERLRQAVEAERIEVTPGRHVTASIGVAAWPLAAATVERHDWAVTLGLADFALYRAKVSGRNRSALVKVADVEGADWPERLDTATLRRWLEEGRAELHLRP